VTGFQPVIRHTIHSINIANTPAKPYNIWLTYLDSIMFEKKTKAQIRAELEQQVQDYLQK